jgi:hypothetical protein
MFNLHVDGMVGALQEVSSIKRKQTTLTTDHGFWLV